MQYMPAFCESCGCVFPSGIVFDTARFGPAHGIRLHGLFGICPKCGAKAHIPDGIFEVVDNTLKVLSASERSMRELKLLAAILAAAQKKNHEPDQIEREIEKEVPAFASLAQYIPKKTSDRIAVIGVLLVAVQTVISMRDKPTQQPVTVEQVINSTYNVRVAPPSAKPTVKSKKVGRNESCPCGSGKKSKHCDCGLAK